MRRAEQIKYVPTHRCPCGQKAVRFASGTFTCARCLELDGTIYGTDRIRATCGVPERRPRGVLFEEALT